MQPSSPLPPARRAARQLFAVALLTAVLLGLATLPTTGISSPSTAAAANPVTLSCNASCQNTRLPSCPPGSALVYHFVLPAQGHPNRQFVSLTANFASGPITTTSFTHKNTQTTITVPAGTTLSSATAQVTGLSASAFFVLSDIHCGQAPPPPSQTGTLKLCKVLAAGTTAPTGTLFTFTVSGHSTPVAVAPGSCTEVGSFPAGSLTVTETGPSGYQVSDISFLAGTGTPNVTAGSTTATIVANQETEVQFTNEQLPSPPATGSLKLCKVLAQGTTATPGTLFTFTVSGQPGTVSVAPGTCAALSGIPTGSVTVTETGPSGYQVSDISFLAGTGTPNVTAGSTTATIVANQETEVQFTNEQLPSPPATGSLKLCKVLAQGTTATPGTLFTFTVSGQPGTVSVAPGTCAALSGIPTGSVTVTETGPSGYQVSDISFLAGTGTPNVAAGSTTATIVANQETEVQFTNQQLTTVTVNKVCVGTTAGTFTLKVGTKTQSVGCGGSLGPVTVPGGVAVTVGETSVPSGFTATVACNGGSASSGGSTSLTPVLGSSNTCTVTNTVKPFIQLCKETEGGLTGSFSFSSTAFPTQSITVTAGATQPVCGPLTQVSMSPISVTEASGPTFTLSGVRTVGPATGCSATLSGTTATVDISGATTAANQCLIIFKNVPVPAPTTTAFVQLCKETTGGLTGTFSFSSPALTAAQAVTVVAGATQPVCGPLTQVTVSGGSLAVTEASGPTFTLSGVRTVGPCSTTLSGTTATVNVSQATSPANQCLIVFQNAPVQPSTQPPVCGTLTMMHNASGQTTGVAITVTGTNLASVYFTTLTNLSASTSPAGTPASVTTAGSTITLTTTPDAVTVTATKLNVNAPGTVGFTVTDQAGNSTHCDPRLRGGKSNQF